MIERQYIDAQNRFAFYTLHHIAHIQKLLINNLRAKLNFKVLRRAIFSNRQACTVIRTKPTSFLFRRAAAN